MYGTLFQGVDIFQFSLNVCNILQGSGNVLGSIAPSVAPPAADASLDPKQVRNMMEYVWAQSRRLNFKH